jgi:LCP family protein required for cell wall assembly
MVNKPTNYYKLEDLKDKNVGMMVTNKSKIEEHLKDYQMKYNTYNSVGELIYSMEEANDAIVISKDFYEYINEEDTNLVLNLRKISEFDVVISSAEIKKQAVESTIDTNNSFIVYLIGVDASNTLNDVNILIVVNPDTHKILLVHVPRDYYVQIDGTTGLKEKLTHAGFYDLNTQINTMSNIFNLEMNAYVKVGYKAVTTIVDDIGGVDVYSDTNFVTSHSPRKHIVVGTNHLNGKEALAYAQERYAYASGDRHRGKNQEDVIAAIIKKISTNKSLLLKYDDLLNDLSPYLMTNINLEDAQTMIKKQINDMPTWSVESISVNGSNSENYTASYPRQWTYVMIPDQNTIDDARSKIMAVMRGTN